MNPVLIIAIASSIWVIVLSAVFLYEDGVGERRILVSVRKRVDKVVIMIAHSIHRLFGWWRAGQLRLFVHFVLHTILRIILQSVRSLEKGVESLLRQNRQSAKKIQFSEETPSSHLAEIARYKQDLPTRKQTNK